MMRRGIRILLDRLAAPRRESVDAIIGGEPSPSQSPFCAGQKPLVGTAKLMIRCCSRTNQAAMIGLFHVRPTVPLAWRVLTYDKRRTGLALVGIFMAILLVFVELGFFYAVPRGGLLLYENMRFDLLLASNEYEYQAQPGAFPLSQLDRVRASPQVAEAMPIYFGFAKWKSGEGGLWPDIFVIGFDPVSRIFVPDSIGRQSSVLDQADTVLVDSATRPMFGPLDTGRVVDIGDRKVRIAGQYVLGTGFMGLGVVLTSTANFARLLPHRGSAVVRS